LRGHGIEFLKGIFWADKEHGDFVWSPLPSRLTKVGKTINQGQNILSTRDVEAKMRGIAESWKGFVLPPLLTTWYETWKPTGSLSEKVIIKGFEWQNVLKTGEDDLWLKNRLTRSTPQELIDLILQRYSLSASQLDQMQQMIKNVGQRFGLFSGGPWERLVLVDYLGFKPPE